MAENVKMDFIICYNSILYKDECIAYIDALNVPENVEIGVITVEQAESLAAGYNQAMRASDAKYKVYMHQDVFILNSNFISDVIELFVQNPEYGMFGVVGTDRKILNGCYWNEWDCGWSYVSTPLHVANKLFRAVDKVTPVEAIDGMIMITQFDLPWREDVFDGFHLYDISQSEEMKRAGYRIGVVPQESPWCLHDCGCNSFGDYDLYRERFCECYFQEGYRYEKLPEQEKYREMGIIAQKFLGAMIQYFNDENWDQVAGLFQQYEMLLSYNTDLQYLLGVYGILARESQGGEKKIYQKGKTFQNYKEEYMRDLFAERRGLKDKVLEGGHGEQPGRRVSESIGRCGAVCGRFDARYGEGTGHG